MSMKQFSGNNYAETAVSFALKDQEMIDSLGYFYSLKDQEMINDVWRIFLQPGMGYVDTKYVTFQCKITSVLNLHFISLKL
jgi:hypothetical protein